MLPRKCLTSCEVPYLCAIACPLNERLDEFAPKPSRFDDVPIDENAPFDIVITDEQESAPNGLPQKDRAQS
ncbi:hypothetical protein ANRL1_02390 [Anaerolineae bacterium]|nr:hypothetical protein ANRL1_02390 [Anaerolineae bacterium]